MAGSESNAISAVGTGDGCRHVAVNSFSGNTPMQRVQPDETTPMPLRQSSRSMGTLMIRFVGLLTLAVIAMTLLWSR